jgi:hypothetical protein
MLTKDNAKANVITAKKNEEQQVQEQAEKFCEEIISAHIKRASEKGLDFAWLETPSEIISIKRAVIDYLRTVGGFTDKDITWQGGNLRIAWGE